MKNFLVILFLLCSISSYSQEENNFIDKVKTIDSIIETLYDVISGDKGQERNWELFNYLFHKDAKLIPSGKNREGTHYFARYLSPKEYIESSGEWLVENGFHEKEISKKVDVFGNIAQVFSTYESFHSKDDTEPFMRGINSIQLLNDGERWWIINIYWSQENSENPIPNVYLKP